MTPTLAGAILNMLSDVILGIGFLIISIGLLGVITTLRMHSEDKRNTAAVISAVIILLGLALFFKTITTDYDSAASPKAASTKVSADTEKLSDKSEK